MRTKGFAGGGTLQILACSRPTARVPLPSENKQTEKDHASTHTQKPHGCVSHHVVFGCVCMMKRRSHETSRAEGSQNDILLLHYLQPSYCIEGWDITYRNNSEYASVIFSSPALLPRQRRRGNRIIGGRAATNTT